MRARTAAALYPTGDSATSNAPTHSIHSLAVSSTRHVRSPRGKLPCPKSCPHLQTDDDAQGKKHRARKDPTHSTACADAARITLARDNLTKQHWFHPLSFQQVQALLTLFSKSFSSFPHGTCLLSVSNPYLAWDEIYHPICAPIPRNVTLRTYAVHGGLRVTNRILTLNDSLFQEAFTRAPASSTS